MKLKTILLASSALVITVAQGFWGAEAAPNRQGGLYGAGPMNVAYTQSNATGQKAKKGKKAGRKGKKGKKAGRKGKKGKKAGRKGKKGKKTARRKTVKPVTRKPKPVVKKKPPVTKRTVKPVTKRTVKRRVTKKPVIRKPLKRKPVIRKRLKRRPVVIVRPYVGTRPPASVMKKTNPFIRKYPHLRNKLMCRYRMNPEYCWKLWSLNHGNDDMRDAP